MPKVKAPWLGVLCARRIRTPFLRNRLIADGAARHEGQGGSAYDNVRYGGIVNPQDSRALAYLASYLAMVNDRKAAFDDLQKALKLAPSSGEGLLRAAVLYHHFGLRPDTLRSLREAVKAGYSKTMIRDTPDFQDLQDDPAFRALIG